MKHIAVASYLLSAHSQATSRSCKRHERGRASSTCSPQSRPCTMESTNTSKQRRRVAGCVFCLEDANDGSLMCSACLDKGRTTGLVPRQDYPLRPARHVPCGGSSHAGSAPVPTPCVFCNVPAHPGSVMCGSCYDKGLKNGMVPAKNKRARTQLTAGPTGSSSTPWVPGASNTSTSTPRFPS